MRQPVLSLLGADSHTLWPGWIEVHQLLQGWLPQAEAFVLKGATHGLQIVDPKNMALGLRDFFGRHPLQDTPEGNDCSVQRRLPIKVDQTMALSIP